MMEIVFPELTEGPLLQKRKMPQGYNMSFNIFRYMYTYGMYSEFKRGPVRMKCLDQERVTPG